ncbi:hypothetical protein STEG23_001752, partial [Scotinomys teguina]
LKVTYGPYDNYIPVSELSKKSWNQQYFSLAFPKPPRPGKKRRSLPSQLINNTAPVIDEQKLVIHRPPLWMHRSLMRIPERPSLYLAARKGLPLKRPRSGKKESKEAGPPKPLSSDKPKKEETVKKIESEAQEKAVLKIVKEESPKPVTKKSSKDAHKDKGSASESEAEKPAGKKEAKRDKKESKDKGSASESEGAKAAGKKEAKKGKKEPKGSASESEAEKPAGKKEAKKGKKEPKDKGSASESEGEKAGGKKEAKK